MIQKILKRSIIFLISLYQFFSPLFPKACRFYPSCSCYAVSAINKFGILKSCFLICKRILKCNPFFPGGYDPIP